MAGPATELRYEYHIRRVTKETFVATSETFEFDYNIAGQRTKLVTPVVGESCRYDYDDVGNVTSVYHDVTYYPDCDGSTAGADESYSYYMYYQYDADGDLHIMFIFVMAAPPWRMTPLPFILIQP
jgi:hypothetical protein